MSFLKKLAERTHQVATAAAESAKTLLEGRKVPDEVREERYDICKQCPNFVSATTTCKKCGCFMAAKTYIDGASCPIGKWQPIILLADK